MKEKRNTKHNNIVAARVHSNRKYDYCPYCNTSMRVRIENESRYASYGRYASGAKVVFVCDCCGSRSPEAYIDTSMLDVDKVIEKMEDICNFEEDEEGEE